MNLDDFHFHGLCFVTEILFPLCVCVCVLNTYFLSSPLIKCLLYGITSLIWWAVMFISQFNLIPLAETFITSKNILKPYPPLKKKKKKRSDESKIHLVLFVEVEKLVRGTVVSILWCLSLSKVSEFISWCFQVEGSAFRLKMIALRFISKNLSSD